MVNFTARGLMPPVFTPLNDDHTINYGVIPAYAKFLADSGIKSVLVGGTTGEHMSLSVADRKKVVDAWVVAAKTTGLHIQVQVGGAPLADVIELARFCQDVGADSLLTLPELYFKPSTVDDLVFYVSQVAKAAPKLPVLYYHIPSMSKVEINMPAFVTAATASIPNFKGIKFTSNDLSEGAQVLRALKDGQEMFLGADTDTRTKHRRTSWHQTVTFSHVDVIQCLTAFTIQSSFICPWVPIMKAGMEIVTGIKVGPPSLPQKPLSSEAKQRIHSKLRTLGLSK
ncbi:hypothetical protein HW555_013474 [Spodoptera exigua]|uniref:N-acetylneuraminate lyase n=1 Tax=Spodoptera exigua TaxID=7107 RepID=A0A835G422_SPOEX|nr:hypothetical protein HW555_013474 [Spodoptera exigua]